LRIFPRAGVNEELKCDEGKGMLLTGKKDKPIGKDCPLDWRHSLEAAIRHTRD
jgi:hypothetical protein